MSQLSAGSTAQVITWPEAIDAAAIAQMFRDKKAKVGVVGLGYVGIPIGLAACNAGHSVLGFDIDPDKPMQLHNKQSYLRHIPSEEIGRVIDTGRFEATSDFERLGEPDALLICVPTPLTQHLEPDLSFVQATAESIAKQLRPGQLIVLESTTYPGTTQEVVSKALEASGLKANKDFFVAFSPEREDPGNLEFSTTGIPKVIGADTPEALEIASALYSGVVGQVVSVPSTRVAEAVKLTENIFRAVNIALVNELKVIYEAMDVNVWDVIEAAKTKPFGYMPFYPGPGLGGHCIPIDPFYLTWKAKGIWHLHALHRACRSDQLEHAEACGQQAGHGAGSAAAQRPQRLAHFDHGYRLQKER